MINREVIKAEIDKVQDRHLELLYRVVKSFVSELPSETRGKDTNWYQFIDQTYGSLADDPLERGEQGSYEVRIDANHLYRRI